MGATAAPPAKRAVDLWLDFYSLEKAEMLPCHTAWRLMDYLRSPSTKLVRAVPSVPSGYVVLTLIGPITDDAIHDKWGKGRSHIVKYTLTKDEVKEWLTGDERGELIKLCKSKHIGAELNLFCLALKLGNHKK